MSALAVDLLIALAGGVLLIVLSPGLAVTLLIAMTVLLACGLLEGARRLRRRR